MHGLVLVYFRNITGRNRRQIVYVIVYRLLASLRTVLKIILKRIKTFVEYFYGIIKNKFCKFENVSGKYT